MARKFFYICAGMLMLALSYDLGASTAAAQAPGNPVVAVFNTSSLVTANGDIYEGSNSNGAVFLNWTLRTNVFSGGGPTPALHQSWGQVKARYHATPGMTVTPGANDK
jgi:hypothetical protein